MKKFLKALKLVAAIIGCFFGVTFIVYFFNLDMKTTALLSPFFDKHYDRIERDNHL